MTRSAKKRGTPAAAVLSNGIRGTRDEMLTSVATRNVGDVVELVERANYRGTQEPVYLFAGSRVKVSAHCGNPVEYVLVTVESSSTVPKSWVAYIAPSTTVRVVREHQPASLYASNAETDPLRRGGL